MEHCLVACLNCSRRFSLDTGRLPLVLSCECTSMCLDCVNQEHRRRRSYILCPKCRKSTPLDRRKVQEQLPPNFFLLGLLTAEIKGLIRYPKDITRSMHSLKTRLEEAASGDADGLEEFVPKIFCGECSESASVNCVKCGGVYCDACFAVVHSSSKSMRTHTSTPLTLSLATPSECSSHPGSVHTHYCHTDSTAVCPDCLLEKHKDHKIIKLHEAALDIHEKLSERIDAGDAVLTRMKKTEKSLEGKLLSLSELLQSTTEKVNMCFTLLHTALQSQEASVLKELNHAVSLYGNALLTTRGIVHSHQVTFSSALAEGRATLKSDYLMVKNGDEIIAKLSDSSLLPQSLSEDRLEPINFAMSPAKEVLESGCLTYDPEYQGPALLSEEGPVKSKYLDVPGKVVSLSSDLRASRSVSPVSSTASEKSSRSVTPVSVSSQGQSAIEKDVPQITRVSAMPPSWSSPGRGRGSRSVTPVRQPVTPVGRLANPVSGSNKSVGSLTITPIIDTQGACDVRISHVEGLDKFYVQTTEQQEELLALIAKLEEHWSDSQTLAAKDLFIGLYCVTRPPQDDGVWCRASVNRYLGDDQVSVYCVDYGRSEDVELSRMRQIPSPLLSHPPLCSECALTKVSPVKQGFYGRASWSKQAKKIFDKVAGMNSIKLKVFDWSEFGVLQVDVLYPVEEGYTSVSAQLVNSGLAIRGVQRPRQETIPPHVTLGCSDTRDVVVPVAENPHDFFVHIEAQTADVGKLVEQVQRSVSMSQLLPIGTPRKGMLCLAEYCTDKKWYRARIIGVEKDGVRVLFLDFGNDHVVPVVYPLHPELCMTQVQAIHCSLFNILPLDGGDKWSEEVADFFNDYVGERVFRMTVRNVGRESMARGGSFKNPLVVEMTERGKDKTLGDVLVTLKMARYKELPAKDDVSEIVRNIISSSSYPLSHQLETAPPGMHPSVDTSSQVTMSQQDSQSLSSMQSQQTTRSRVHSPSPRRMSPNVWGQKAKPLRKGQESVTQHLVIPQPVLPSKGADIPCSVSHFTDLHSFSIVILDEEYTELMQQVAYISQCNHPPPTLGVGDACLALYPADKTWHRAVVTEKSTKTTVSIHYVDYGDTTQVSISDVQPIPRVLCRYPARAIKCTLEGVESSLTPRASVLFYQLVSSSGLHARIHGATDDGVLSVSLVHPEKGDVTEAVMVGETSLTTTKYDLFNKCLLPQGSFTMQVTFFSDGFVCGHVISKESKDMIQKVARDVESVCRMAVSVQCANLLSVDESCCAQYSEDGSWNRAVVKRVDQEHDKLEVLFIDFGNTELVDARVVVKCVVHPEIPALAVTVKVGVKEKVEVDGRYEVDYLPEVYSYPPHVSLTLV